MSAPASSTVMAGPGPTRIAPADLVALVKPNIALMALLTAAGGMSLAPGPLAGAHVLVLMLGTALIVASANALNMYLERDIDCLMARTRNRPLPMGRLAPRVAMAVGIACGIVSLPLLALVNALTGALGLIALISYVGIYTPLKQRTHWAVWVGSLPGAMPALMGYTAVTGTLSWPGLAIFGVLFIWQVPHFHAIAMYRQRESERAGLHTLPGSRGFAVTRRHIVLYLVMQVAVSLTLWPLGIVGAWYLGVAIALGVLVLAQAIAGMRSGEARWARQVFMLSLLYVPTLFITMVLDGRL